MNSGDFLDVDFGWRYACAVADHFWAGAAMQIEQVSEDEQTRRRAFNEDIRVSIALGISVEQVLERREQSAIDWMTWLTAKMIEQKADEPQHIMHVICARLEERGASLGRVRAERKLPVACARSVDQGPGAMSKTYKPSVPRARRRPAYARIEQNIRAR